VQERRQQLARHPHGVTALQSTASAETIPRLLWTFWERTDAPETVTTFLSRTRETNAAWDMQANGTAWNYSILHRGHDLVLTGELAVPPIDGLPRARLSEWYSLVAMARYGGVWMNASTVPLEPLEAWVDMSSDALVQGFSPPSGGELMDTFAFAAPANSAFVRAWLAEYESALRANASTYLANHPPPANFAAADGYLLQHATYATVRPQFTAAQVAVQPSYVAGGPLSLQYACSSYGSTGASVPGATADACVADALFSTARSAFNATPFVCLSDAERLAIRPLTELRAQNAWLATELLDAVPADLVRVAYQPATRPYRDPVPALWMIFGIVGMVMIGCGALGGLGWLAMRCLRGGAPAATVDEKRVPLATSSSS